MFKTIILMAAFWSTPAWSAGAGTLQLDGMRLSISHDEFIKARPEAVGENNWYMYSPVPKEKKELGFPVRGYMRGFESGRGCAAAIGFAKTSAIDTERLTKDIEAMLTANKMVRTSVNEEGGARFTYWEGPDAFASMDRFAKGSESYGVSLQVSLKNCPESATTFKTRPPAAQGR